MWGLLPLDKTAWGLPSLGELWLKEGGGVSGSSKAESIEVRGSGAAGRGRGYKRRWRKKICFLRRRRITEKEKEDLQKAGPSG